jgi:hypothetical protein
MKRVLVLCGLTLALLAPAQAASAGDANCLGKDISGVAHELQPLGAVMSTVARGIFEPLPSTRPGAGDEVAAHRAGDGPGSTC